MPDLLSEKGGTLKNSALLILLIFIILGTFGIVYRFGTNTTSLATQPSETSNVVFKAETVGNHSWISIDIITSQTEILQKIADFEKAHPELELYDVNIDWSSRRIIWLHHRPRVK